MICRNCRGGNFELFCDLGYQPLANNYLTYQQLNHEPEVYYPLRPKTCTACGLVQLEDVGVEFTPAYAFEAGASQPWVEHTERLAQFLVERFDPDTVLEIGSNDGTLLRAFRDLGVCGVGVDPAGHGDYVARVPWTLDLALTMRGTQDLIIGTNVLAHVDDLDDFLNGVHVALAENGVAVFEVPDTQTMVEHGRFEMVYHEHLTYFTHATLLDALSRRGLHVFAIQHPHTHGGSIRVLAQRSPMAGPLTSSHRLPNFRQTPQAIRHRIRQAWPTEGVLGWGASAKASTLLNFLGFTSEQVYAIADSTPSKQGKLMPGSHIPITDEERWHDWPVETVIILSFNYEDAIREKIAKMRSKPRILSLADYRRSLAPSA